MQQKKMWMHYMLIGISIFFLLGIGCFRRADYSLMLNGFISMKLDTILLTILLFGAILMLNLTIQLSILKMEMVRKTWARKVLFRPLMPQ